MHFQKLHYQKRHQEFQQCISKHHTITMQARVSLCISQSRAEQKTLVNSSLALPNERLLPFKLHHYLLGLSIPKAGGSAPPTHLKQEKAKFSLQRTVSKHEARCSLLSGMRNKDPGQEYFQEQQQHLKTRWLS